MSFDSFQTSGNSPGRARRIALLGFGPAGSAVAGGLFDRTRIPDPKLVSILDLADRSQDQSLHEHKTTRGVRLQSDHVRREPDATGYAEAA